MRFRWRHRLLLVFVVWLFCTLGFGWWSLFSPLTPPAESSVSIESGSSLLSIANTLADHQIIRSALTFRLLARIQGRATALQAGTYSFTRAAAASVVLDRLTAGDVDQVSITIPEGFNLQQIARRLAEAGVADQTKIIAAAQDAAFLDKLGVKAKSLEGYLFPETYHFVPGISRFELLRMMVNETELQLLRLQKLDKHKTHFNRHQLLTLASIIQKETGQEEEMPLISAVFYNRLARNMPLQTDPTVIYGIPDFNGNLTRKDLQTQSPYNTYLNRGLPPGPIASPGFKALQAAAEPAQSDYLYFVARGDGTHQFSSTLAEHNRAVRKFQLHH
ncbi:endolytic transglycosylase MltG [Geopsychrobacter electrodiphilus]|uniref:endolytic transglycosylase MltG n=1 Tax=Geopsychrobacter electrodiphilus TaxID=225196 RepID=UPI0003814BE6|nr:endolytic transglycosylase MltG [Geopsychrobacter electrodiphilus]